MTWRAAAADDGTVTDVARREGAFRLHEEPDFARFWTGQSISLIGSQVTMMALPLTAIIILDADEVDQGLLFFCQYLPALLFGLQVGTIVDRFTKRRLLVMADVVRALLVTAVVLLYAVDQLSLWALMFIAFLLGAFDVLAAVGGQSFIPKLVPEPRLMDANGKLQKVTTFAEVSGNSLAGLLVQALTPPLALLVDAASFLASAVTLGRVREAGAPVPAADGAKAPQALDGFLFLFRDARLRYISLCNATSNFFSAMMVALYLLYATQALGIAPGVVGVLLTVASGMALVANTVTARSTRRLGVRGTLVAGQLVMAAGCLVLPATAGSMGVKSVLLVVSHSVFVIGMVAFTITQLTYRQSVTPEYMQGRVHAGNHMLTYGSYAAGALMGGLVGDWIGMRETLVLGALGHVLAAVWLLPRRAWDTQAQTGLEEADVHS
ncbi:putative MFS family arabinose efflux permease [Streptomyces sp. BK208]|nr:putative MFS family arabinose efflux permease [Streptomyces sp. BK208]